MKNKIILTFFVILNVIFFSYTGNEIMENFKEKIKSFDSQKSVFVIRVWDNGIIKNRKIDVYILYKNNKTLSLMRVTEPNDVKNTTVLNISEDEQYVYMPSLRSVKRISGNGKDESFLDTDFKYSDLNIISGDISDNYYLYSEDNENYILKYDFNDDSEYGYSFLKISKSDFLMSEISFFSKNEKPLKKLYIENYIKNGEKYTIKNIKVESQISDHYTELNMENTEYDIPITEKFFNKINISMPVLIYR